MSAETKLVKRVGPNPSATGGMVPPGFLPPIEFEEEPHDDRKGNLKHQLGPLAVGTS